MQFQVQGYNDKMQRFKPLCQQNNSQKVKNWQKFDKKTFLANISIFNANERKKNKKMTKKQCFDTNIITNLITII